MAGNRITNITIQPGGVLNDIHDNTHCTIIVPKPTTSESVTPPENDYKAVVRWLNEEKMADRDWYKDSNYNRTEMCRRISKELGWIVDPNSLGKAQKN